MFYRFKEIMIIGIFVLGVVGCTAQRHLGSEAQSQFTYPNSNVMPLGNVTGKASTFVPSTLIPDTLAANILDASNNEVNLISELTKKAIDDALSKKADANILLDYFVTKKETDFGLARKIEISIEGQAAKAQVGKQDIY